MITAATTYRHVIVELTYTQPEPPSMGQYAAFFETMAARGHRHCVLDTGGREAPLLAACTACHRQFHLRWQAGPPGPDADAVPPVPPCDGALA